MLDVRIDTTAAEKKLDATQRRHIPFATKLAINRTAGAARERLYRQMQSELQMPTRYTMNSLFIKNAQERKLEAWVMLKDAALQQKSGGLTPREVLRHLFEGGDREWKRFEKALKKIGVLPHGMAAVPGEGAPLDQHGNIPPQLIIQLLAYFRAFGQEGYKANMTAKSRAAFERRLSKKAAGAVEFFIVPTTGTSRAGTWFGRRSWKNGRKQTLFPGIWQRVSYGSGTAIKPIIMFVKKPRYAKKFDLPGTVREAVVQDFPIEFDQAIAYALRTAR